MPELQKSKYLAGMKKEGYDYDQVTPISTYSYQELLTRLALEPKIEPHSSGIPTLDEILGGFEDGRLYVLSAPTKAGKTTMAQTIMYNMAHAGTPSLFFSYEMGWQEVVKKFQDMDNMRRNTNTNLPMYMPLELHRGGGELQYQWLFEAIAKAKDERGVKLVIVDHLHFLLPLQDFRNTSFVIGGIVREIKRMAVALHIPVILICHVAKIKDDKIPDWTDIRDSSFITQEADVVFMMYRIKNKSAAKKITDDTTEETYTNTTMLSVELNRMTGKTGKVKLWHDGAMFVPYTGQDAESNFIRDVHYASTKRDSKNVS